MGALGLGVSFSPLNALSNSHREHSSKFFGSTNFFNPLEISSIKFITKKNHMSAIRMQVVEEEYELKQMKDMAAAKKRWDAMIREGRVKVLTPREAGYAIQLSNRTLLDIRPSTERKKAWVKGSTWIPIFETDSGLDVGALSRKMTNFMMGGWWSGVPTLSYDRNFLAKVQEKFPKDTDLIVACQKGLRSLAACELLSNYGYSNLFWVQGGLDAAEEEDFETEGPQPLKFAGIGGLSEFLGNTESLRMISGRCLIYTDQPLERCLHYKPPLDI